MALAEQTEHSERDLLIIWADNWADNIKRGVEAADAVIEFFKQKCQTIAGMPGMGRRHEEYRAGLRSLPVGKHTIFYRIKDYGILVERVLYSASDIDAAFPVSEDEETEP